MKRSTRETSFPEPDTPHRQGRVSGRVGDLDRPEVAICRVALAVETDSALTTKLVDVANSAACAGIDSASSVDDALVRTGLEQAKTMVEGVTFRTFVFGVSGYEQAMDMLRRRSLALLEHDPRLRHTAFLLSLVQDFAEPSCSPRSRARRR